MIDYTDKECPVCGKFFLDDDDIVVCPECGAPHHRECYNAHGRCGCAEQHGTEDAWDKQQERQQAAEQAATRPCPYCGGQIQENAVFCSHCGRQLNQPQQQAPYGAAPGPQPFYGGNPQAGAYNPFDPMGGVRADEDFDGVPASSLAKLIQVNIRKYMVAFKRMKETGRCRFSVAGLFFGAGWLLYRKQYRIGSILAAVTACLYAGELIIGYLFTTPLLRTALDSLGITGNTAMTQSTVQQVMDSIWSKGFGMAALFFLPALLSLLRIALHVVIAARGSRWYYHHLVKTSKEIDSVPQTAAERDQAYHQRGGGQIVILLIYLGVFFASRYIPMAFL